MSAVQIVLLCVAAAALLVTLRSQKPEIAIGLAMAAGVVALALSLSDLQLVVEAFTQLSSQAGVLSTSTQLMLRAAGVALIAEFGAQLCRDAGEGTLAGRIEFGARIALLSMSVPLFTGLTSRLMGLFP